MNATPGRTAVVRRNVQLQRRLDSLWTTSGIRNIQAMCH
jgi:hypothetical protein